MILKGRRFPGSSAPGDLSSLGVGGRPDFCGGLCAGRKAAFGYTVLVKNRANVVILVITVWTVFMKLSLLTLISHLTCIQEFFFIVILNTQILQNCYTHFLWGKSAFVPHVVSYHGCVLLPARRGCCHFAVLLAWRRGALVGGQSQNGSQWERQVAP